MPRVGGDAGGLLYLSSLVCVCVEGVCIPRIALIPLTSFLSQPPEVVLFTTFLLISHEFWSAADTVS